MLPSPGSSSSEHVYREVAPQHQQHSHQPFASSSGSVVAAFAPQVAAPESANGSEDSREKENKLKRTREGCYTCRNRKKKCDQVRPICGSCSRLSFTCEFPPQVINAEGQLVTVRQPNKRKKDRLATTDGSTIGATTGDGLQDVKKRIKTHPGPRPGSKAAAAAALEAAAGDKGKGREGQGATAAPMGGAGNGGPSDQVNAMMNPQSTPSQPFLEPIPPPHHHRTYSNSTTADQSVLSDFQQNGSHHAITVDDTYPPVDGQSHFLQARAMSGSSQGSASSGFSMPQNYLPGQLRGSPNLPIGMLPPTQHVQSNQASGVARPSNNNGTRSFPSSSENGAAGIRERFDQMVAQRSPMQSSVPNISFDQSAASISGTPDLFNRPFSPFSTSVTQDPETQNRLLQEMHRQFQQSFPQPTTAPSPSFSEWMKSFGDTMDSPGQIFDDGSLKPVPGLDAQARFSVPGVPESPMTWLAPSPAPSSLHLGMSQTPHYQHSHLHSTLQSSPLHQSQTPLHPSQTPLLNVHQQQQPAFDARLSHSSSIAHYSNMPPPQTRTSPSRPTAPGPSQTGSTVIPLNGNGSQGRAYGTTSSQSGSSIQHVSPPGQSVWQPESLDLPNTSYLPAAFIEPIPDENDSDTRAFINGYTDGKPSTDAPPGSPVVRAGPNRSVVITSSLSPTITIKLPDLPHSIADQAPLLIDYFVRKLSPLISVLSPSKAPGLGRLTAPAPGGSDIASVFVPMASQSKLMLLSVLGWSSMHLHELGEPWREIADLLRTQLIDRVETAFIAWEEKKSPYINDEEMLAALVALSEIEICRGSTSKWYRPLIMARQVIRRIGGADKIRKLNWNTKWLLQNWAYHSLLSSTDCLDGPSLDPEEYAAILCGGLSSFMGPSMIVFQIIAETSRLSVEAAHCIHSDRDTRIEALRVLAAKDARLKARLDAVYPEFPPSEDLTTPETSYHLAAFRCFVLTARLYLRQVVSHCNAHSLVTQLLVNQLLANIGNVIGTPAESSLLFPLFITGVDATTESDRRIIKGHFLVIDNNCRIGNIQTAYSLLEEIWERNDSGATWIDWPKLSRQMGWNISFA